MSNKSVVQKLFVKPGYRVGVIGAPPGMVEKLGALPGNARLEMKLGKNLDVILGFVTTMNRLREILPKIKGASKGIWVAYPKKTSSTPSDMHRDRIAAAAPEFGLQVVSMFAIDDDWSAMRLKVL